MGSSIVGRIVVHTVAPTSIVLVLLLLAVAEKCCCHADNKRSDSWTKATSSHVDTASFSASASCLLLASRTERSFPTNTATRRKMSIQHYNPARICDGLSGLRHIPNGSEMHNILKTRLKLTRLSVTCFLRHPSQFSLFMEIIGTCRYPQGRARATMLTCCLTRSQH
jgi:hypothetical protein